jgi:hypothetical protein
MDGKMSLLRQVTISSTGEQKQLIFKRLVNGSNDNMNVDGSVTPVVFSIAPPAGEVWRIYSWDLYIEDAGSFDAASWGNGITLTNGLMPILNINGTDYDMLEFGIKTSGELSSICDGIQHLTFGAGNEIVTAEWDFINSGQYVRLTENDSIKLVVRDDLTNLVNQYTTIKGYKE